MTLDALIARLSGASTHLRADMMGVMAERALAGERAAKINATGSPRVRSGRLRASIYGVARAAPGEGVELALGSGGTDRGSVRYARIQEKGGEVRPVRGRFLAIPKGPALTGAGVARYASPRDVPNLRFVSIRGGSMGLLVKDHPGRGKAGTGARSDIWFLLVRSVYIRPKAYLFRAVEEIEPTIGPAIGARLTRRLVGGA